MSDVQQSAVEDILHVATICSKERMFWSSDCSASIIEEKRPSRTLWAMRGMDDRYIGGAMQKGIMGWVDHQIRFGKPFQSK